VSAGCELRHTFLCGEIINDGVGEVEVLPVVRSTKAELGGKPHQGRKRQFTLQMFKWSLLPGIIILAEYLLE
jgi:hypothetical protein